MEQCNKQGECMQIYMRNYATYLVQALSMKSVTFNSATGSATAATVAFNAVIDKNCVAARPTAAEPSNCVMYASILIQMSQAQISGTTTRSDHEVVVQQSNSDTYTQIYS